jgi:hypothetical protein
MTDSGREREDTPQMLTRETFHAFKGGRYAVDKDLRERGITALFGDDPTPPEGITPERERWWLAGYRSKLYEVLDYTVPRWMEFDEYLNLSPEAQKSVSFDWNIEYRMKGLTVDHL